MAYQSAIITRASAADKSSASASSGDEQVETLGTAHLMVSEHHSALDFDYPAYSAESLHLEPLYAPRMERVKV